MAAQRGRKPATSRKRTGKRRTTKKQQERLNAEIRDEVFLLGGIAVTVLLFLCNFHIIGKAGNAVSDFMFGVFGILAYITPPVLFFAVLFGIVNLGSRTATIKICAGVVLYFDLEIAAALASKMLDTSYSVKTYYSFSVANKFSGGVLGGIITKGLVSLVGVVGVIVLVLILLIVCLVLLTEKSFMKVIAGQGKRVIQTAREDVDRRMERNEELRIQRQQERVEREQYKEKIRQKRMDNKVTGVLTDVTLPNKKKSKSLGEIPNDVHEILPETENFITESNIQDLKLAPSDIEFDELANIHIKGIEPVTDKQDVYENENKPRTHKVEVLGSETPNMNESLGDNQTHCNKKHNGNSQSYSNNQTLDNYEYNGEVSKQNDEVDMQKISSALEESADQMMQSPPPKPKPYKKPPITLLKKSENSSGSDSEKQLKETAMQLKQTLKTFGVNVTITDISQGPAVTRYELQPEMGVKVSKIVNLTDDIKLNLAATDIRIEAPIPGKAAIGIEVPNKENSMVLLRDLLDTKNFRDFKSNIAFAVGKDIAGQTVVSDIGKMPHVLIAGSTGSGKSVCINTLIMSILYKSSPEDVKMIMVDPKVVELSVYNGIPHLMLPVVTDPKKAAAALHWGVSEMTERYKKFEDMHVRDLKGYNKKVEEMTENDGQELPQKMPQIVIIVDELADLMMVAPGEVEESICRLAQLARAAGIHLVIATQRPSVDVITGLIKANMPSRIAFAVSSGVDSRTILDMNGAEKLLGKGDMLFHPQGYPKPIRVQGAFVSDKEVSDVVDFLKEHNGTDSQYVDGIEQQIAQMGSGSDQGTGKGSSVDEKDMYFADAGRFIIDKEKASIGMLQRVFKIGFNRAARIMDQLCEYGVVGEEEGTKPRKVLMTMEQFEQLLEDI